MDVARAPVCREEPCSRGGKLRIWPTHGRNGNYLPLYPEGTTMLSVGIAHQTAAPFLRSGTLRQFSSQRCCFKHWLAGWTNLACRTSKAPAGVFARGRISDPARASPHGVVGHGLLDGFKKNAMYRFAVDTALGRACWTFVDRHAASVRRFIRGLRRLHHPGPPRALCPSPHGRPRHEATRGSHVENASPVLADQTTHIRGLAIPSRARDPCARHLWESGRHHSMGLVQALAWPRQPARSLCPCGFRARHEAPRNGRGIALPYLAHFR